MSINAAPDTMPTPDPMPQMDAQQDGLERPLRDAWRSFFRNKSAVIGAGVILFVILVALIGPLLLPFGYNQVDADARLQAPSAEHWFGTDDLGRDIFARVVNGARISLWVGFFAVTGSIVAGSVLGLLAGFYGRWLDVLISRMFDILLAFPGILLAIAIVAMLGPSLENAMYAIAVINIPTFGRLMRSRVLAVKQEDFVLAARAIGMKDRRILFQHILPNSWTPIMVQGTLCFATAVIEAAGLGFLGLGAQPPEPEWGKMLSDSRQYIQSAPWTMLFPGVAIIFTVLGFNLLGDGMRDILDPRMKQ